MNPSPSSATITVGRPSPSPGTSANSEIVSALVNELSAAAARSRCGWVSPRSESRSSVTETATNSRPTSAPATPALASKKLWNDSGVRRDTVPGSGFTRPVTVCYHGSIRPVRIA